MITIGPRYKKLRTDLHLACNRLKILQAKQSQVIYKRHREIEDFVAKDKYIQAKSKLLTVLREEAYQEAMERVEMFCEDLSSRFGLLQETKKLEKSLEEAVSSLIWVAPYIQSKVPELEYISKELSAKYGRKYAQASRKNKKGTVCPELVQRINFEITPDDLTMECLGNILRKYHHIPKTNKAAFKLYIMKTLKTDSIDNLTMMSKEEDAPIKVCTLSKDDISEVEGKKIPEDHETNTEASPISFRNKLNNSKITNRPKKPFTCWIKKLIRVKTPPHSSEGEEDNVSVQNNILPTNSDTENVPTRNPSDFTGFMYKYPPNKSISSENTAKQHGISRNVEYSAINVDAGKLYFDEECAKQNGKNANKKNDIPSFCPGKCDVIDVFNDDKQIEASSERSKVSDVEPYFPASLDANSAHWNRIITKYPDIDQEETGTRTETENTYGIKGKFNYTYNQNILSTDFNMLTEPLDWDEPPPYDTICGNNGNNIQVYDKGIDRQFDLTPIFLPSPPPSCPSDDGRSSEETEKYSEEKI